MLTKKSKVAKNFKSCGKSQKFPKISKVAETLPSNFWLSLPLGAPKPLAFIQTDFHLNFRY